MTYFLVPQVLWVVTSFGIVIGLGGLSFNFVFPIKITAPPYNWPVVSLSEDDTGKGIGSWQLTLRYSQAPDSTLSVR